MHMKTEIKKRVYNVRRHSGSLCTQRQLKIAALAAATSKADLGGVIPLCICIYGFLGGGGWGTIQATTKQQAGKCV